MYLPFFLAESISDVLLQISLNIISADKCNKSYSSGHKKLKYGITPDSMICADLYKDKEDTCLVCTYAMFNL